MTCRHDGCRRSPAYPGHAYCAEHALRWVPRESVERTPAWVKRAQEGRLPARIEGGIAA